MAANLPPSPVHVLQREIDRCHAQIAEFQKLLRAGDPAVGGLCLALQDWSTELRIIEGQLERGTSFRF